jgi:hypothetical protein
MLVLFLCEAVPVEADIETSEHVEFRARYKLPWTSSGVTYEESFKPPLWECVKVYKQGLEGMSRNAYYFGLEYLEYNLVSLIKAHIETPYYHSAQHDFVTTDGGGRTTRCWVMLKDAVLLP